MVTKIWNRQEYLDINKVEERVRFPPEAPFYE